MSFTLDLSDISLFMAFVSVILLLTTEILSHFGFAQGLLVDKSRLRLLALATGLVFLAIVAFRVYQVLYP